MSVSGDDTVDCGVGTIVGAACILDGREDVDCFCDELFSTSKSLKSATAIIAYTNY